MRGHVEGTIIARVTMSIFDWRGWLRLGGRGGFLFSSVVELVIYCSWKLRGREKEERQNMKEAPSLFVRVIELSGCRTMNFRFIQSKSAIRQSDRQANWHGRDWGVVHIVDQ